MKKQKNLLLISAIISLLFGLTAIFIPQSLMKFFDVPSDQMTPNFIAWVTVTGITAFGTGIITLWMRTLTDTKAMKGAMSIIAFIYLLLGLESMFEPTIVKGMPYTTTTIVMGIVFLIIAVVFYLFRTPKEVTK